jgi:DNA replication protein DnaC
VARRGTHHFDFVRSQGANRIFMTRKRAGGDSGARTYWKICEDRYQVRSSILTSRLPVSRLHEQKIPRWPDGILDRLMYNAHRIEDAGDSMRKNRGNPKAK